MGRLENIIERNRRAGRPTERTVVMLVVGFALLLIIALMLFTDLGAPPTPTPGAAREHRVDDILLRKAPK